MLQFLLFFQRICIQVVAFTCTPIIQSYLSAFTQINIDVSTDVPDSTQIKLIYGMTLNYYTSSIALNGKANFKLYFHTTGIWKLKFSCSGSVSDQTISVVDLSIALDFPIAPSDTQLPYDLYVNVDVTGLTLVAGLTCKISAEDTSGNLITNKISGTSLLSTVINGKCSHNFQFLEVGTYNIIATVFETCSNVFFPNKISKLVQITNPITLVKISPTAALITAFTIVSFDLSIFKGDNVAFTDGCLLDFDIKNSTDILDSGTQTTTTGTVTISFSITNVGDLFLTVKATSQSFTANTLSNTLLFTVQPLNFMISAVTGTNSVPSLSIEEFSLSIQVVDLNDIKVNNILPSVTAKISLTTISVGNSGLTIYDGTSAYPTGSFTKILVKGEALVTGLKILSSGNFQLEVSSDFSPQIIPMSLNLSIKNKIKSIEEVTSSGITKASNYFNKDLIYKLIGEDDNPYLLECTIDLVDSESSMIGTTNFTQVPLNGNFTIPGVCFRTAGMKNIIAGVRGTSINVAHQINITKSKLVANFITAVPLTSSDLFSLRVKVKDSEQQLNDLLYNPHVITFSLDSQGDPGLFEGLSSMSTSNSGFAEFIDYKIKSAGSFKIRISSPNLESWVSTWISIQFVSANIKFNSTQLNQSRNSLFLFNVRVLELNGTPYLYSTILSLTCSNASDVFFMTQAILTSNSTANFYLSFLTEGLKSCMITSGNSTNIALTFNISSSLINEDPMCFIAVSNHTCYRCIPQASLSDGVCSCVPFSSYNHLSQRCECETGLSVYQEICSACGNYFTSEELSSYFSRDYKSVIIKFGRPINQTLGGICTDAVNMPRSLMNLTYNCYLPDLYTMQLDFKSNLPAIESTLSLSPLKIQSVGSECSYDISLLQVLIKAKYSLPLPLSSIVGPSIISIKCSTDGLTLRSKYIIPEYNYSWSISSKSSLSDYVSTQSSPSLSLASKSLNAGNVTFKLTVTLSLYNTTAQSKFIVNIMNEEAMLVVITNGASINVHAYDSLYLKASILNRCSLSNSFEYTWSYSLSSVDEKFDFSSMTNKDQKNAFLKVNKGSLKPNTNYRFNVNVVLGIVSGSASIEVNVVSSDLVVKLSRSSGIVGIQSDFIIDYSVKDPDNECTIKEITAIWSCKENENPCLGSDDTVLELKSNTTSLFVPKGKLRNKAYYTFKVTASCPRKAQKTSSSIDIYIDRNKLSDIRIESILDPILSTDDFTIIPSITAVEQAKFLWTIAPPAYIFKPDQPILFIPQNTLLPGIVYMITLTLYVDSIEDGVSTYRYLAVKPVPICDKLAIDTSTKGKVRFNAINCQNAEPLNALSFNFGYLKGSEIIWLTRPIFTSSIDLLISIQYVQGIVKVCNSFKSCNSYTSIIPKTEAGDLVFNISRYADETYDPEYIPSSIIYYSRLLTNYQELKYIYDSFSDFFAVNNSDDSYLDSLLDCTTAMLNNSFSLQNTSIDILEGSTKFLIDIMKFYKKPVNDEQRSKLFKALTISNDKRSPSRVLQVLNLLSDINMKLKPLDYTLHYHTKNITVYTYRNLGSAFVNRTTQVDKDTIFMKNVESISTTVYDIQYTKYSHIEQSFSLSYFQEGTCVKYNYLRNSTKEPVSSSNNTSIIVAIDGPFDESLQYACMTHNGYDWLYEGCSIVSLNSTVAVILLDYFTSCRIVELYLNCETGLGPILAMIFLIILCIILGIYTRKADEFIPKYNFEKLLLIIYPLTSICIPQPHYRRSFVVFQLFSGQLLILTLIVVFQYSFDSAENYKSNFNYSASQLTKGLIGWILAQILNLPIFFLNAIFIKYKRFHLLALPMMIIITVSCFFALTAITLRYCSGWSSYWILNFLVFMIFDLTLQLLYSALLNHFFNLKIVPYEENSQINESISLGQITLNLKSII